MLLTALLTLAHSKLAFSRYPGPPDQGSHYLQWAGPSYSNPQKNPHKKTISQSDGGYSYPQLKLPWITQSCVKLRYYLWYVFVFWKILGGATHIESWLWTKHFNSTTQGTATTSENTNDNSLLYEGSPFERNKSGNHVDSAGKWNTALEGNIHIQHQAGLVPSPKF